jgi:hypothetical protein
MASQSENSVSVELGELLELLNALEAQDSLPLENFATLERLLAAGKIGPAESSSDDYQSEVGGGVSDAEAPSSSEELIAERQGWHEDERPEDERREDERPEAEIENRLAVHIIQGMRKSIKDWTS